MALVRFDYETRSRVNLKKYGLYRYVACPDFRLLMGTWSVDGGPTVATQGHEETVERLRHHLAAGDEFTAHNAQFERVASSAALGMPPGQYLDPHGWHCTMAVAAERGLPGSLDALAKALGCTPKDTAGADLIRFFCVPISTGALKGQFRDPKDHPDKWLEFLMYGIQDTETLVEVDEKMGHRHVTPTEQKVYVVDQYINDRGIRIDVPLARAAEQAALLNTERQKARVTELSGIVNAKSVQQVRGWLTEQGIETKNLRAKTVETLLMGGPDVQPLNGLQREVLELRTELALAAPAKYGTALESVLPDGRLRGTMKHFGAHTGRWAGRGTQPHNLPRLAFKDTINPATGKPYPGSGILDQEMAILDVLDGDPVSTEDLKRLVRALFVGPFTVVDYTSIEAFVLAWLAGEEWVLQAARDGRDIYVETANRMGGLTRAQGKIAVLALGYNGGANSLRAMLSDKDMYQGRPMKDMTDQELRDTFVIPWRKANPKIVKLWARIQDAFMHGGQAGPKMQVKFTKGSKAQCRNTHLMLPSGRAISYRNVGWENYVVVDDVTEKRIKKQGLRFDAPSGARTGTYGGKLTENATQAVARDLLAAALIRLHEAGYEVAAHVHDEILTEGEHDPEIIGDLMCQLPDWAAGLPLKAEGFTTQRYRKG